MATWSVTDRGRRDYRVFFKRIDGVLDGLEIEYPQLMRISLIIVRPCQKIKQSRGLTYPNEKERNVDDQLKQLFDYTKFHIGMYTTLVVGIIGVFATDSLKRDAYSKMIPFLEASVILFLIAGMFGGLVASSIPFFKTFDAFSQARLAPWSTSQDKGIPSIICTHFEHLAFWLGCVVAVVGLFVALGK
jgi:hypothetical protein